VSDSPARLSRFSLLLLTLSLSLSPAPAAAPNDNSPDDYSRRGRSLARTQIAAELDFAQGVANDLPHTASNLRSRRHDHSNLPRSAGASWLLSQDRCHVAGIRSEEATAPSFNRNDAGALFALNHHC